MSPIDIKSNAALADVCQHWQQQAMLGIDTEFIRTDTFHPIPALIQVSDGTDAWLVDVLAIDDFSPLAAVFANEHIVKVLHAYSEDLEVFDVLIGAQPNPIFDTQFAAALAGFGHGLGYSKLVLEICGEEIAKDQSRSDWLARPLSAEQRHYASLDVIHLPQIYQVLLAKLTARNRLAWCIEENARLIEKYWQQKDAIYPVEKVSNGWRLPVEAQKRLAHLVIGRDALARQYNKPRNAIARDHALVDLARKPPTHVAQLSQIDGIKPSAVRMFGKALIELANNTPDNMVFTPLDKPLNRIQSERFKHVRHAVESVAQTHDVPVELLIRKQEIEQLVRQAEQAEIQFPERLANGFRKQLLTEALARALTENPHD